MKVETLYNEIGMIDDDLIEEAFGIKPIKIKRNYWKVIKYSASIAAVLIVSLVINQFESQDDMLVFNQVPGIFSMKVDMTFDTSEVLEINELGNYLDLDITDRMGDDFMLEENQMFTHYLMDQEVVEDTSLINYVSGESKITMKVSKLGHHYGVTIDGINQVSVINGMDVYLSVYNRGYIAEFEYKEIYVTLVLEDDSHKLDVEDFIEIIKEIVK